MTGAGAAPSAVRPGHPAPLSARARRAAEEAGVMPAKPRSTRHAPAKVRLGSRCWTRVKTSPLASLRGSHQPRPPWLTITISPGPRRYLRLRRVLSARSSRQTGGSRSSSAAQLTLAFSRSFSSFCPCIAPSSSRDRPGTDGSGAMPFPSPSAPPCPPGTAKPARGKGVRSTGAHSATHPCGAPGASGSADGPACGDAPITQQRLGKGRR